MEIVSRPTGLPKTESANPLSIRLLSDEWNDRWDTLAGKCPGSGFMQSSSWARFKRVEGYGHWLIGLFDNDELIGGTSLFQYVGLEGSGMVVCPEGPVLPWSNHVLARQGLKLIIEESRRLTAGTGEIGLRIEPHLPPPAPSLLRKWVRAPVDLTPVDTIIVDVTRTDSEILGAMQPKARYNLGLSMKHGVRVIRSTDPKDIQLFYPLLLETSSRSGFFSEPYGFFINYADTLLPSKASVLYLAEWQGEILASILVFFFGSRATYLYGASTRDNRHVMPTYALHWAAIQETRDRGCLEYDLYGYDPFGHPDHLYAGISQFKRQWGGKPREYIGARDFIFYDRLAERIVERAAADGHI
jgi:lipid II:glycine glycyltransferase (peptidoglycan interpeptide bridge formation enzyme)